MLFITTQGYIRLCLASEEIDNLVSIILGCDMPVLLRERDESHRLRVFGEAYVHGTMDGEAVEGLTMENHTRVLNRSTLK